MMIRSPPRPVSVPFTEEMARLLGYYCAEGSVIADRERPNSYGLVFAFGLHEIELAEETGLILKLINESTNVLASLALRPMRASPQANSRYVTILTVI